MSSGHTRTRRGCSGRKPSTVSQDTSVHHGWTVPCWRNKCAASDSPPPPSGPLTGSTVRWQTATWVAATSCAAALRMEPFLGTQTQDMTPAPFFDRLDPQRRRSACAGLGLSSVGVTYKDFFQARTQMGSLGGHRHSGHRGKPSDPNQRSVSRRVQL